MGDIGYVIIGMAILILIGYSIVRFGWKEDYKRKYGKEMTKGGVVVRTIAIIVGTTILMYIMGDASYFIGYLTGPVLIGYATVRLWWKKDYKRKHGKEMTKGGVAARTIFIAVGLTMIALIGRMM